MGMRMRVVNCLFGVVYDARDGREWGRFVDIMIVIHYAIKHL